MLEDAGFKYNDCSIHWKEENGNKVRIVDEADFSPAFGVWKKTKDDIEIIVAVNEKWYYDI